VIGIAAGTVLLPEMSRRIAAGDTAGAHAAQNRAVGFTLALAAPFCIAFLAMPDLVMSALFQHGAFDAEASRRAGAVLAAYALGLPAIVLIRSAVASFNARQDTTTPLLASVTAVGVNIVLKVFLTGPFGVVGLALGTVAGAWVNFGLLTLLALRRGWTAPSGALGRVLVAVVAGSTVLGVFAWLAPTPLSRLLAPLGRWQTESLLAVLGSAGIVLYGVILLLSLRGLGVRLARR
jgi:putative peptidoglycan lipid II flippase